MYVLLSVNSWFYLIPLQKFFTCEGDESSGVPSDTSMFVFIFVFNEIYVQKCLFPSEIRRQKIFVFTNLAFSKKDIGDYINMIFILIFETSFHILVLNILNMYTINCFLFQVMFSAWRERNAEKRIEIAHNALQQEGKYVCH
jgi:hypothetical protein